MLATTPRRARRTPPTRGRRLRGLVALLGLTALFAGACVGQQDPTGYSSGVREDFVAGCVAGFAPADGSEDREADHHTELCGCIYDEMSDDDTGIPFDEFKGAQSAIREDPTDPDHSLDELIPEFREFVDTCERQFRAGP